uniref:Uncharacterized protein n=1 Tax=Cacopsylla melanoneura TaxID=428564 RepID=A0A8D8LTN2_9HEMI
MLPPCASLHPVTEVHTRDLALLAAGTPSVRRPWMLSVLICATPPDTQSSFPLRLGCGHTPRAVLTVPKTRTGPSRVIHPVVLVRGSRCLCHLARVRDLLVKRFL